VAATAGMLGGIDANRGDYQNAWDTTSSPTALNETAGADAWPLRNGLACKAAAELDAKIPAAPDSPTFLLRPHRRDDTLRAHFNCRCATAKSPGENAQRTLCVLTASGATSRKA